MKKEKKLFEKLRSATINNRATLFGVADLAAIRADTDLLNPCYDEYSRGISIGIALDNRAFAGIVDGPTDEYCREYLRVNELLDSVAEVVTEEILKAGAKAVRIPASEIVDWERLRGHVSHKLIGRYAGHGWIGKNILLVNPEFGARVRYVSILTDLPLPAGVPLEEECDECTRCVRTCPAHAIGNKPSEFDLQACFNKLGEFNERLGKPHFICGICVKACRGSQDGRGG
ncbi:MAG: epoxyqueuosine reductase [Candidatus Abyssubacteria bacterium]